MPRREAPPAASFLRKLMVSDRKIHRALRTRTTLQTKPIREIFHFHHLPKLYIGFNLKSFIEIVMVRHDWLWTMQVTQCCHYSSHWWHAENGQLYFLKVLGKSVGLCKTTKRKDQLYISLLVSVWRIICENFNPNGLILAEIWMKI